MTRKRPDSRSMSDRHWPEVLALECKHTSAGPLPASPETAEDLPYQDEITTGPEDVGYQWLQKSYTEQVQVGADGRLHVALGVWGTWETPRTYYLDDLRIVAEAIPAD